MIISGLSSREQTSNLPTTRSLDLGDRTPSISIDSVALYDNPIGLPGGWVRLRAGDWGVVGSQQASAPVITVAPVTEC